LDDAVHAGGLGPAFAACGKLIWIKVQRTCRFTLYPLVAILSVSVSQPAAARLRGYRAANNIRRWNVAVFQTAAAFGAFACPDCCDCNNQGMVSPPCRAPAALI